MSTSTSTVTVKFGQHLSSTNEVDYHYIWVDIEGAGELYAAKPEAASCHRGNIRWSTDTRNYNLDGLTAAGWALLEQLQAAGFVEIWSGNGFKSFRAQIRWSDKPCHSTNWNEAQEELFGVVYNFFDNQVVTGTAYPRH